MANHSFEDSVLFDKIVAKISTNGPLSLAQFISIALGDSDYGYYKKKDPFGAAGDFTTAPEVSGLFGEMCGLYLAHLYQLSGLTIQLSLSLVRHGTLMADMRHVLQRVMPSLKRHQCISLKLVQNCATPNKLSCPVLIFFGIAISTTCQSNPSLLLQMNFLTPCPWLMPFGGKTFKIPPGSGGTA